MLANQTLAQQVSSLTTQLVSLPAAFYKPCGTAYPAQFWRTISEPCSEPFSGEPSQCKGFIFQCELFFQLKPVSLSSELARIQFVLGLLRERALVWAEARFNGRTLEGLTYSAFIEEFRQVSMFLFPRFVLYQLQRLSLQALIDSGAEKNFVDMQVAEQAGILSEPLEKPRNALVVDGRILAQVTHRTFPVTLVISDILIYSKTLFDHQLNVRQVLQRLLENCLFVKKEKCELNSTLPNQEAAPLTALTSPSHPFTWSKEAERAFNRLKTLFTTAPVLVQPDPALQFVVEVDASDVGVGALLSQKQGPDTQLHPCAFSRRLSPAEANYDVSNRELLAVKLALEEWPHWLEGSTQPFVVWTDHKNLSYIQTAKWLNSRQARYSNGLTPQKFTPTTSLLQPLPVPGRPWSHIALDFVSGLPLSDGNTVILTIVDHFSKAAHLVALTKLPTADLLTHVVRLHGIPLEIVSDQGPQFISQ
ncbi:hypothetical protein L3Q82_009714, partial [Scortum barcoo]